MGRKVGHGKAHMFGMSQKSKGRVSPAYFYLSFDLDEDEEPDNIGNTPPKSGKMVMTYFTVGLDEWKRIFEKWDNFEMSWEETRKYTNDVEFEAFPTAIELWKDLINRLKRGEISKEDVAAGMVEASARYQAERITCG
ncbi:MAG: hypothetical protein V1875_09435 [Candidatus Altiarchaeota archaeon]